MFIYRLLNIYRKESLLIYINNNFLLIQDSTVINILKILFIKFIKFINIIPPVPVF